MPLLSSLVRRAASVAALGALAACDVPSGIPQWDTTWNVPSKSLSVGVAQVLPAGVTVAPDGSSFLVGVAPVTVSQRLSDVCPACSSAANGMTIPKPAFTSRLSSTSALPAGISSGTLVAGTAVAIRISNGYNFDPIRPNGTTGAAGYLTIVIRNGATVLGRDSVSGATAALPANGGVLTRTVTLAGGTLTGDIQADVEISSPAGGPIQLDVQRAVTVTATPSALRISQARVSVQNTQVSESTTTDLDISGGLTDRVRGGKLLLDVRDPFGVSGALRVRVTGQGVDFAKPLTIGGGNRAYVVEFSREELQAMFGKSVTFTFTGPVSTNGAVTVTPSQAVEIGTRFELVVSSNS